MNILVITNNLGGLYSFRKEVIKAILDRGDRAVISAPYDNYMSFFEDMGCKMLDTQFNRKGTNPIKDLGLVYKYCRIIKSERPDVVLSYTIKPNLYGGMACQLCHIPQIANITGLGKAVENKGWLQNLTMVLYKIGLRKAFTVFFQNSANQSFCLEHHMVKGRNMLIPGSGVNLDYHSFQEYPTDNIIYFVFIGRLLKEKGIEEYLYAAQEIKIRYPQTEFLVVGPCEDAYEEKLHDLEIKGIVFNCGPQKDVRSFIGRSHCVVHPSYYPEGMSNVLLEACAAGRPIITTNRPGCGEVVDEGINGFIVKQQDPSDLIEKIERFILLPNDKKRKMGLAARKKVEREFDRNIVIKAYIDEIGKIGDVHKT